MKRLALIASVLVLGAWSLGASCPVKPPNPGPTPTPEPTPSPVCQPPDIVTSCWHRPPGQPWLYICPGGSPQVSDPKECPQVVPGEPLKAVGSEFQPPILGSITTHHNWPLVDATALDAIAAAGLNYAAMRLPLMADERGPAYELYERAPGSASAFVPRSAVLGFVASRDAEEAGAALLAAQAQAASSPARAMLARRGAVVPTAAPQFDLSRFSKAFDSNLGGVLEYARSKGIYVNLGLWDGWGMVHEELPLFWRAGNNVQGIDLGYCSDFGAAPTPTHIALVEHVVTVAGRFPNVIWELGNEANRCRPSAAFIDGMRAKVRETETRLGYARHLWSPGTLNDDLSGERGSEYDYLSAHGNPKPKQSVPVEVNEFAPMGQAEYLQKLAQAKQFGTVYHYWHDDVPGTYPPGTPWDSALWEAEWRDTLTKMQSAPPTTGCTNIPNEDSVAVTPRPPANPAYADAINAAMVKVTGCDVGSQCPIEEPMQSFFARVTEEIRKGGLCAGVQTDSEGPVDQICVGTEQECQGNHVFSCRADGCHHGFVGWAPGSYTNRNGDTWVRPGPPSNPCLPAPPLGKIELKNAGVNRVVVDATPKTCADQEWNRKCSTGNTCSPGGAEGNPDRATVEAQWGPWTWTVDGASCVSCFLDGGNPLRLVAPGMEGRTIRLTGGNGTFAEIVGSHP